MLVSTYRPGTLTMLECRVNKATHHVIIFFTGRAIVTYCGMSGTTICDSPSMSLDEVRNIAARDEQVPFCESAQVGDIMFIKGAKYNEKG